MNTEALSSCFIYETFLSKQTVLPTGMGISVSKVRLYLFYNSIG